MKTYVDVPELAGWSLDKLLKLRETAADAALIDELRTAGLAGCGESHGTWRLDVLDKLSFDASRYLALSHLAPIENATPPVVFAALLREARYASEVLGQVAAELLIEESDPVRLLWRVEVADWLSRDETPPMLLSELRRELKAFIKHQQECRDYLIETGLSRKCWTGKRWLNLRLGRLYQTRKSTSPHPISTMPGPPHGKAYSADRKVSPYQFVHYPAENKNEGPSNETDHEELKKAGRGHIVGKLKLCDYAAADYYEPLLRRLSRDDLANLESLRASFFDARVSVLEHTLEAIVAGTPCDLVSEAVATLKDVVQGKEWPFLLRAESAYLPAGLPAPLDNHWNPGGVLDLLTVVGYVEAELKSQTADRLAKDMPQALVKACESAPLSEEVYYAAIRSLPPQSGGQDAGGDVSGTDDSATESETGLAELNEYLDEAGLLIAAQIDVWWEFAAQLESDVKAAIPHNSKAKANLEDGPYRDRRWVCDGRASTKRLTSAQFNFAAYLHQARDAESVPISTLKHEEVLNPYIEPDSAKKMARRVNEFFDSESMPLEIKWDTRANMLHFWLDTPD